MDKFETSQLDKVAIIKRRIISDSRGWFLKTLTGLEDDLPSHTGEIYLTMGKKGESKGGHYHPCALEWFTLIQGKAILKLEDIVTKDQKTIELSFENPQTIFIPNGVAHVIVNNSEEDFILLAYTDKLYDPSDTITYKFLK